MILQILHGEGEDCIQINDCSCLTVWVGLTACQTQKTKLKLKHLIEQGAPWCFRGPYAACVFCVYSALILYIVCCCKTKRRDEKHQTTLRKQSVGQQNSAKGIRTANMSAGDVTR